MTSDSDSSCAAIDWGAAGIPISDAPAAAGLNTDDQLLNCSVAGGIWRLEWQRRLKKDLRRSPASGSAVRNDGKPLKLTVWLHASRTVQQWQQHNLQLFARSKSRLVLDLVTVNFKMVSGTLVVAQIISQIPTGVNSVLTFHFHFFKLLWKFWLKFCRIWLNTSMDSFVKLLEHYWVLLWNSNVMECAEILLLFIIIVILLSVFITAESVSRQMAVLKKSAKYFFKISYIR